MILQLARLPPDADAQSRELDGAQFLNDRLQPVVAAGRSARAHPQTPQRKIRIVDDDQHVRRRELVERRDLADRPTAQVHEGRRLGEQHAFADLRDLRRPRFPLRAIFQRHAIALRKLLGHLEPDVVPRVLVLAAGIAKTNDQLHTIGTYFLSFLPAAGAGAASAAFLVLLALLDDLRLGRRSRRARRCRIRHAGTSSTFGMMTWSSIVSGSVDRLPLRIGRDILHADALADHELADVHFDVVRNVGRQALDFDLAMHDVEHAALLLDALRLALRHDRHLDAEQLVHRDAIEVGVQQLVGDRIELILAHQHARVARAGHVQRDQRVRALLGAQNLRQHLRIDGDRLAAFLAAVDDGGNPAARAQAPSLVLASVSCVQLRLIRLP